MIERALWYVVSVGALLFVSWLVLRDRDDAGRARLWLGAAVFSWLVVLVAMWLQGG